MWTLMSQGIVGSAKTTLSIFLLLFFSMPHAHSQSADFSGLDRGQIEEIKAEAIKNGSMNDFVEGWVPRAQQNFSIPFECGPETFQDYLASAKNHADWSVRLRSLFKNCHKILSRHSPFSQIYAYVKNSALEYDYLRREGFKEYFYKTPDGLKIRFYLGLKPGTKSWPLVVVKCGTMCDLDSGTLKRAAMMLFDEGPFNVALVPNVTGSQFMRDNRIYALGGIEEGRQLFYLTRYLKNESPFKNRFSSIHVNSTSMGSNASLYLSLYNSYNDGPVESIFGGCSVVDLENTFHTLFKNKSLPALVMFRRFSEQMQTESKEIPSILSIYKKLSLTKLVFGVLPDFIGELAANFYSTASLGARWALQPFVGVRLSSAESVFAAHRFQNFANKARTNTFLWSSEHDAVVNTEVNVGVLRKISSNVDQSHSSIQTLVTPLGGHCDFDQYYGWNTVGKMLRSYYELHSPELRERTHLAVFSIAEYLTLPWYQRRAGGSDTVLGLEWKVSPNSQTVELVEKIRALNNVNAGSRNTMGPYSFRQNKYKIPLATFARYTGWSVPNNAAQAQAYTRYLNANTRFLSSDARSYVRSAAKLGQVSLRFYR